MNESHKSIIDVFSSNVFNEIIMRERLPKTVYKAFKECLDAGRPVLSLVLQRAAR